MSIVAGLKSFLVVGLIALSFSVRADAGLITNGDFETGDLTGWTVTDSDGSLGSFYVTGDSTTPLTGFPTVGPFDGSFYAVSDAFNPGSHALTQTFSVPVDFLSANLSLEIFVNDEFGAAGFGGEVDLLAANADPLLGSPIAVFYSADTTVDGGLPNPYVSVNQDITGDLVGGTSYQFRILESDSSGPIHVGVDAISLNISTPEPATQVPLFVLSALGILAARRRAGA